MKISVLQRFTGCCLLLVVGQVICEEYKQTTDETAITITKEDKATYVKTTYYQTSIDRFKEIENDVKGVIATKATEYCSSNTKKCGLEVSTEQKSKDNMSAVHQFDSSAVIVKDGYPVQDRAYTTVPIAVMLPENSTENQENAYLNQAALKEILEQSADLIREKNGAVLLKVEKKMLNNPPNNILNAAIIPVACIILLIFIIIAITIRIRTQKQEHKTAAKEIAMEDVKKPVKLVEMRKSEEEPESSSADGTPAKEKDALLEDENAVRA